jgi:hypothetical protein
MAGNRFTRFQQDVIANGEPTSKELLRLFADRLLANAGYPPVLPVAGQELHNLLNELEEALNVRGTDNTNTLELSDS